MSLEETYLTAIRTIAETLEFPMYHVARQSDETMFDVSDTRIIIVTQNRGDQLVTISYLENGKLHREDGPATIHMNPDGQVIAEHWLENGCHHRTGAPAIKTLDHNMAVYANKGVVEAIVADGVKVVGGGTWGQ